MKTIIKIFGTALSTVAVLALASCAQEPEYTPAEQESGSSLYFSADAPSTVGIDTEGSSFDVYVLRANPSGSLSLTIDAEDESGLFTIPTEVSFEDGQSSFAITIGYSYNEDDFPYDDFHEISLTIPEENRSLYGLYNYTFGAGAESTWTSLDGTALYRDDFFTYLYGADPLEWEVEIQENDAFPGLFRLVYPYDDKYGFNESYDDGTADWDLTQTYYMQIDCQDPDGVYIPLQNTGVDWGDGFVYVYSLAAYYLDSGFTLEDAKAAGVCGTYSDGVITFPTDALLSYLPDYYSDYYFDANTNGLFRVVMPGVVLGDYSIDVSYPGSFTDTSDGTHVVASVTLGEDAVSAKVALVPGTNYADELTALISGESTDYEEITSSGSVLFDSPGTGYYAFIAVSFDSDGNTKESSYCTFIYNEDVNFTPSLEALVGTYTVAETSYFGGNHNVEWVIEESDDQDYDIMLTVFDDFECDTPIYGNFDAETGEFTFDDWQKFSSFYGYDLWFDAESEDGYVSFTLNAEGLFTGPDNDLFGSFMTDPDYTEDDEEYYYSYYDLYESVVGIRDADDGGGTETDSVSSARTSSVSASIGHKLDKPLKKISKSKAKSAH